MKVFLLILFTPLLLLGKTVDGKSQLNSGRISLKTHSEAGEWISFEDSRVGRSYEMQSPILLDVNGESLTGRYQQVIHKDDSLICQGSIRSPNGTIFTFEDQFRTVAPDAIEMDRKVVITDAHSEDLFFNTSVSIPLGREILFEKQEFFVPGIWYRTNFLSKIAGALAADPTDRDFLFREDRLPLPIVMARNPQDAAALAIVHLKAEPNTFEGDKGRARVVDSRLQFGSVGVRKKDQVELTFLYPGSEGEKSRVPPATPSGWALRSHPVSQDCRHRYTLLITFPSGSSYPDAIDKTWKQSFSFYQPKLRTVDLEATLQGLLETLQFYSVGKHNGYDVPGFPFSVFLPEGKVRAYNYQMGFVGRQIPNAFYLIHEGLDAGRNDWVEIGESIVEFWAKESPLPDGLPLTWYNPSRLENTRGHWRNNDNRHGGTAIRVAATGMIGMLNAWRKMEMAGRDKPLWLETCRRFGDWLLANQNADGSTYLSYNHTLVDGRHPPTETSKSTSSTPIRFLLQLHQATADPLYKAAAIRAGEFCLKETHDSYHYAGSVIDNPVTIDRESGQEALSAFLALYDATREKRWLEAAVQAARYTETWMYAYEVPAVQGSGAVGFPEERSIVGQTLIATGQSSADLGLAFSSFDYYRLYLFTGDSHFLDLSKLLFHNTKQSLNWDRSLYPELPKGLQLEAFLVTIPRRRGVLECLSWNYAAHLDSLIRLKDQFGEIDVDAIERLPLEKRRALNESLPRF